MNLQMIWKGIFVHGISPSSFSFFTSGTELLSSKAVPDLIFLDIKMGEESGLNTSHNQGDQYEGKAGISYCL
ncbi:hypothetical protein [Lacrimispora xylanisolvens]|uniref:hypothetical protein n=1 Tax=Lacrimispora xylanisolvens TaxID=384636 RepID=UPI0024028AB7